MTDESQTYVNNSVKSFHQRYHLGPKIDIISRCEPFSNPHYLDCIRVCQGYLDVDLCLPMSALIVWILNYLELAPHKLSCNSYICLRMLTELNKHYGPSVLSLGYFEHYFWIITSIDYSHMYMIVNRARTSLVFKNLNKMEYTDNWMEIRGEFYEGDVPFTHFLLRNVLLL